MALEPRDIERMIMQAHYRQAISQPSAYDGDTADMNELVQAQQQHIQAQQQQIRELIGAVETMLDANKKMGKDNKALTEQMRQANAKMVAMQTYISTLEDKISTLEGKNAAHNRHRFGENNEKTSSSRKSGKGKTKDEEEEKFIEDETKPVDPVAEDDTDDNDTPESDADADSQEQPAEPKERDLSNRPDHYNTMHADVCVIHDCDIDKLAEMGLEFIRYTRPVDQIDRISTTRQDRYLYVWVKDKNGNEFPFFIPKADDAKSRQCVFSNEKQYDAPRLVPHTSSTGGMLSDIAVNRFQYALSSGREMYRMINEKLHMSKQTIHNWLKQGAKFLKGSLSYVKRKLLKPGTVIYCDESWVDTKIRQADGSYKYKKRYMWVIVNLTTNMCYYLYGSRKKSVIQEFLKDFKSTLMTDAYAAYSYFSKIKDCTHVCCWAHSRRIYVSALEDYKDKLAEEFIKLISILYKVETESIYFHRTEEEILKARKLESIPVLHQLKQKAEELLGRADAKLTKISAKLHHALTYMLNNWSELTGYVTIGNVLIDNNCCERAVRPFTNLRKSFGGFSSEEGAETAAAYLTFVETCKLQKKAPLDFFKGFFGMIVDGRRDYDLMTEALLC